MPICPNCSERVARLGDPGEVGRRLDLQVRGADRDHERIDERIVEFAAQRVGGAPRRAPGHATFDPERHLREPVSPPRAEHDRNRPGGEDEPGMAHGSGGQSHRPLEIRTGGDRRA